MGNPKNIYYHLRKIFMVVNLRSNEGIRRQNSSPDMIMLDSNHAEQKFLLNLCLKMKDEVKLAKTISVF